MIHSNESENDRTISDQLAEYADQLENGNGTPTPRLPEDQSSSLKEIVDDLHWAAGAIDAEKQATPWLGNFKIEELLGRGGQSETFLAWDNELQRRVVLKIYPQHGCNEKAQAVLREGRLLSRVNSPIVVKCLGVESFNAHPENCPSKHSSSDEPLAQDLEIQSPPYLVLEHVEGTPLDMRLRLNPVDTQEIRRIMRQLAQGLACVHAAGLIHRDIKPGNIIINENGEPKLIDFGLAISTDDEGAGLGSGTVAYMSPEQALQQEVLDERTDIFGLGSVMYHLLTGYPLYRAASKEETRQLAQSARFDDIRALNPNADKTLAKVCMKCLQADPRLRFQSAEELRHALDKPQRRWVPLCVGALAVVCVIGWLLRAQIRSDVSRSAKEILTVNVSGGDQNEQGIFEFQTDATVHLEVTVQQAGFLRVWSQDGKVCRQLFPNAVQPERKLAAGETVLVPDPRQARLRLTESTETEFFRVVVSDGHLPVLRGDAQGNFVATDSAEEQARLKAELDKRFNTASRGAEVTLIEDVAGSGGRMLAEQFIPFRVEPTSPSVVRAQYPPLKRAANSLPRVSFSSRIRLGQIYNHRQMYDEATTGDTILKTQELRAAGDWSAAADGAESLLEHASSLSESNQMRREIERFVADTFDVAGRRDKAVELRKQVLGRFDQSVIDDSGRTELTLELQLSQVLSDPDLLSAVREIDQNFYQFVALVPSDSERAYRLIDACLALENEIPLTYRRYLISKVLFWRGAWRCEHGQLETGGSDLKRTFAYCEPELHRRYNEAVMVWNARLAPTGAKYVLAKHRPTIHFGGPMVDQQQARKAYEYQKRQVSLFTRKLEAGQLVNQGDIPKAEKLLWETLSDSDEFYGPAHLWSCAIRTELAQIFSATGRPQEACRMYRQIWELSCEAQQAGIGTHDLSFMSSHLDLALRNWVSTLDLQSVPNVRQAYEAIWRSRWLVESATIHSAQKVLPAPLQQDYHRLVHLNQDIRKDMVYGVRGKEHRRFTLFPRDTGTTPVHRAAAAKEIMQDLCDASPAYREAIALSHATIDEIAGCINPRCGVVELYELCGPRSLQGHFRPSLPRYGAFVIKCDDSTLDIAWTELGRADILNDASETWSHLCEQGQASHGHESARMLRKLVWEPLKSHVEDLESIVVIPRGSLSKLPWCSLPTDERDGYLIDLLDVSYANSGQELLHLFRQRDAKVNGMMVMGGIDYGPFKTTTTDSAGHRAASVEFDSMVVGSSEPHQQWGSLPGSWSEARAVAGAYDSDEVTLLSGRAATEMNVTSQLLHQRYIHLATHGYYNPPPPPEVQVMESQSRAEFQRRQQASSPGDLYFEEFERIGLLLAGANQWPTEPASSTSQDGVLSGNEVANLSLPNTELVVLSACTSAVGTVKQEGILGLQRAFHTAGARAVLACQWNVNDQLTRAFMRRYYQNLFDRSMSKKAALRQAQLALRNGELTGGRKQPTNVWAGWVLSGDFR